MENILAIVFGRLLYCFVLGAMLYSLIRGVLSFQRSTNAGLRKGKHNPSHRTFPQISWLFGLDILFQDWQAIAHHRASEQAAERHSQIGTTYTTSILGRKTIHTIEPKNIYAVTTHNFGDYEKADWTKEISKHMGNGILVNDGKEWESSRTMLKPLFRRSRAGDIKLFERHVGKLMGWLEKNGSRFFDFKRVASMLTLDVTTEMLFGESAGTLELLDGNGEEGTQTKPNLLRLIEDLEPYGNLAMEFGVFALLPMALRYRRIMGLVRGIQAFFEEGIRSKIAGLKGMEMSEGVEGAKTQQDAIQLMMRKGLVPKEIQGELQNIFFAAYDTTTALLTNIFDTIARHPQVFEKLKNEMSIYCPGEDISPSEGDIARMHYLRATIHETIRLYSPVTNHVRTACRDTTIPLGGGLDGHSPLLVRAGESVVWNTYALNRRHDIYGPDALAFRPERWIGGKMEGAEAFMPFGSGPRNCLGQRFAMLQISYAVVRLLRAVDGVELMDQRPFLEAKAVTFFNGRGTWVRFLKEDGEGVSGGDNRKAE